MPHTFHASTRAQVLSALSKAAGGDTILLAGGNYGAVKLHDLNFAADVTIRSADTQNPATFTGLDLWASKNITLDGITFDYTFSAGEPDWAMPFGVQGCQNVTIKNSTFDGDDATGVSAEANGYGNGYGLFISSSDVTIENNEFFNFYRGIVVHSSDGITLRNNNLHSMASDGIDFAQASNVLIEGNWVHDFERSPLSGAHPDMIQFWTSGTNTPSTNITIRGNLLDIGEGADSQSIFMRNEMVDSGEAGSEMFYRNILIENNTIVNGHAHGITVGETAGLIIRNNTVLHADGGSPDGYDPFVEIPQINVAVTSTGVVITRNITEAINGYSGQPGWTVDGNVLAQDQDPSAPNYYADIFLASSRSLVGNSGRNVLVGNAAANLLFGHAGADILAGGWGSDTLYGEEGSDTLYGGHGSDNLVGGRGNDHYVVTSADDLVREMGGEGYDAVQSFGSYALGANIEKAILLAGGQHLIGNSLDNALIGSGDRNWLSGHAGGDLMDGRRGRDTLSGDRGNDTLTGGAGADRFIFADDGGRDVVRDFDASGPGHDVLGLRGLTAVRNFQDLKTEHLHQVGHDAVISAGNVQIVLHGVRAADLVADDFLF